MSYQILCTCPPMIGGIDTVKFRFAELDAEVFCPTFSQTMSEEELISLVPQFDGWIIGDDPATRQVFAAGKAGQLKAAVRWGVGTDNVDFPAAREYGYKVVNTPGMFNEEVSDVAIGYLIALARDLLLIDRGVRAGGWPKPPGQTLTGKTCALVGFGNIGRSTARKLLALGLRVVAYDPFYHGDPLIPVETADWPERVNEADFVILTCSLTPSSRHTINRTTLQAMKAGVKIVNVGRGPLVDEMALIESLRSGHVAGAALDVFEEEPLSSDSALRGFDHCIFGSHNSSNTLEAVQRTSLRAIDLLFQHLAPAAPPEPTA